MEKVLAHLGMSQKRGSLIFLRLGSGLFANSLVACLQSITQSGSVAWASQVAKATRAAWEAWIPVQSLRVALSHFSYLGGWLQ